MSNYWSLKKNYYERINKKVQKKLEKHLKINLGDDSMSDTYQVLSDWKNSVYGDTKSVGSITIKDGKSYFGDTELDTDDPESIGRLITQSIAKQLLEGENK